MKEIEITCKVLVSFEEAIEHFNKLGFELVEQFIVNDSYFSKLSKNQIKNSSEQEVLKNSILVRQFIEADKVTSQLVYKNKEYDKSGNVISEEKNKVNVEDIKQTKKVLRAFGLTNVCEYMQKVITFKKENIEIMLQQVEGLGVFIEFEQLPKHKNLKPEKVKKDLINIIKTINLPIGDDYNIRKAEIVIKKYKSNL